MVILSPLMDNQIRRQTEKHSAKQSLGVLITSANGLVAACMPLDHEKRRGREGEEVEEGRRCIKHRHPPSPDPMKSWWMRSCPIFLSRLETFLLWKSCVSILLLLLFADWSVFWWNFLVFFSDYFHSINIIMDFCFEYAEEEEEENVDEACPQTSRRLVLLSVAWIRMISHSFGF